LAASGVTSEMMLTWGDEMRVGLCSCVRRVWAPRGVKVRALVQWKGEWSYLALAVDGRRGQLCWKWIENMKGCSIASAVAAWKEGGVEAVVWDQARGHLGAQVRAVGVPTIEQPAACPELNPAERVFEELRRGIEGRVYSCLGDKVAAVEALLHELASHPQRVRQLAGWEWIHAACSTLPQKPSLLLLQNAA
jgi:DDE superfamily endonuclease